MDASSVRRNPIISSASLELQPAVELIANNVDLLAQILLYFPVKSLIRFKSVSKHWLSLISDSKFAAKHTSRNPRPSISGLFLRNCKTGNTKFVSRHGSKSRPILAFLDGIGVDQCRREITHSCNGLLLCKYRHSVDSFDHYLVCNPTTKTHTLIPHPPAFSWVPGSSRAFLDFDPSKSPGYRVVFLGDCFSKVEKFYIHVYRSEGASWKRFRVPDRRLTHEVICDREVICGGVIYWLSDGGVVLGFDIDSEKMIEKATHPKIPCVAAKIIYFGECNDRLILIQTPLIQTPTMSTVKYRILEMDKDCSRWIVKFQVNLEPSHLVKRNFCSYHVLCVVKEDKEKDFELVLNFGGTVISYNLRGQRWNVLNKLASGESNSYITTAYPYAESLSPL